MFLSPSLCSILFWFDFILSSSSPSFSVTSLATPVESKYCFPSSCHKSPMVDSRWTDSGHMSLLNALVARELGGVDGWCTPPPGLWGQPRRNLLAAGGGGKVPQRQTRPLTWKMRLDTAQAKQTQKQQVSNTGSMWLSWINMNSRATN